jgi:hypothetical protein
MINSGRSKEPEPDDANLNVSLRIAGASDAPRVAVEA